MPLFKSMILLSRTVINDSQLEQWCARLPACETFLRNFFATCQLYEYRVNHRNYEYDLTLYAQSEGWIDYIPNLLSAFRDIATDVTTLN